MAEAGSELRPSGSRPHKLLLLQQAPTVDGLRMVWGRKSQLPGFSGATGLMVVLFTDGHNVRKRLAGGGRAGGQGAEDCWGSRALIWTY